MTMSKESEPIDYKPPLEPGERLADVICPQCKRPFRLCWDDYPTRQHTLRIYACPSGGVYNVKVRCPYCDYEEGL